LVEYE